VPKTRHKSLCEIHTTHKKIILICPFYLSSDLHSEVAILDTVENIGIIQSALKSTLSDSSQKHFQRKLYTSKQESTKQIVDGRESIKAFSLRCVINLNGQLTTGTGQWLSTRVYLSSSHQPFISPSIGRTCVCF
jgi:hypothetical protein